MQAARRESVVEQTREPSGFVRDDCEQGLSHLVADVLLLQRQRRAVDGRQGRSQLVGDHCDELVLQPVELAEAIERSVKPAFVEGNRHERADHHEGDERREMPENDERRRQRSHDEERQERRDDVAAERRGKRNSALTRDDG
jgi:hypothetical protein